MATVINHNIHAQLALGELNKNVTKVGKLLGKVSSGQKINSAQDDASGYVISEKMREQIRSLLQDNQNVQNGSALFKIAEGGINNIVEELRHLKELAINAANDTNTDQDRAIIQKEFSQKMANINDIATTTNYNGKTLLDGTYSRHIIDKGYYNLNVDDKNIAINSVKKLFDNSGFISATADPLNGKETPSVSWINGRPVLEAHDWTWFPLDFSGVENKDGTAMNLPEDMHGQGFFVICGGNSDSGADIGWRYPWCQSRHSFVFDANMPVGTGAKGYSDDMAITVSVGIGGITNASDLARAFFEGVKDAMSDLNNNGQQYTHWNSGTTVTSVTVSDDCIVIPSGASWGWWNGGGFNPLAGDWVAFRDNKDGTYSFMRDYAVWIYEGFPTEDGMPYPPTSNIDYKFNPLKIHHGPKANQATNFYINDMHTKSLGTGKLMDSYGMPINESDLARYDALSYDEKLQTAWVETLKAASKKTLDDVSVTTQKNANVAIRVIDGALDYALNEATEIGSYLQRLEYTDINITTMGENVQAAESTIRDADMAKEMTEYTKYNILQQSAQAMLAQANQNSSGVLSLLQ